MDTNQRRGAKTDIRRHWLNVLEENQVQCIVLDPQHDGPLIEQLQTQSEWIVEFVSAEAIFFVRDEISVRN